MNPLNAAQNLVDHTEQSAMSLAATTLTTAAELVQANKELASQLSSTTRGIATEVEAVQAKRYHSIKKWNYVLLTLHLISTTSLVVLTVNFLQFMDAFSKGLANLQPW